MAGQDGFFEPHDVIVADNATVHREVAEMLWQCYRVLVIFLPTRTCEWNPMELIWQTMVKRMNNRPLCAIRREHGYGKNILANTAKHELDRMTTDEVKEYYAKCYSFLKHWKTLSNKHRV